MTEEQLTAIVNVEQNWTQKETLREGDDLTKGGVKFDAGKARYDLLPPEGAEAVAAILELGAKKYAARNWEQGMDWSRPFSACMRHLWKWWGGEKLDPDSGYSHLWHAGCNLFFLIAYEARSVGKDDRATPQSSYPQRSQGDPCTFGRGTDDRPKT